MLVFFSRNYFFYPCPLAGLMVAHVRKLSFKKNRLLTFHHHFSGALFDYITAYMYTVNIVYNYIDALIPSSFSASISKALFRMLH